MEIENIPDDLLDMLKRLKQMVHDRDDMIEKLLIRLEEKNSNGLPTDGHS